MWTARNAARNSPCPKKEGTPELFGLPHHEPRLQHAKLLAGHKGTDTSDVRQTARDVINLAREFLPVLQIGDEVERGKNFFARRKLVQIDEFFRGESAVDFRERFRLDAIRHPQRCSHRDRCQHRARKLDPAPATSPPRRTDHRRTFRRLTAGYRHKRRRNPVRPDPCSISFNRECTLSRLFSIFTTRLLASPYGTMLRYSSSAR